MIRRYPFGKENALDIMISEVIRQAVQENQQLTETDVQLLKTDFNPKRRTVSPADEARFKFLVERVIEREEAVPKVKNNWKVRSFSNALEWAADQRYPYIAHLAEECFRERQGLSPRQDALRALFQLFSVIVMIVVVIFLVIHLVSLWK